MPAGRYSRGGVCVLAPGEISAICELAGMFLAFLRTKERGFAPGRGDAILNVNRRTSGLRETGDLS